MTSVDSGVETGNDSNDSAQTESQTNNQVFHKVTTMNTSTMNTQMEIQSMQKQEIDGTKFDMQRSPTSTIILSSDDPMSFAPQTNLKLLENNFVFNLESEVGDTETSQFKTPPKFLIHPKLLKQTISITCPHSYFSGAVSLSNFDQDIKPVSFRVSPGHKAKRPEYRGRHWRSIPYRSRQMRLAAATNNVQMMQRLLEMGISPNNHDEQGRSPLHLASCRGYNEIVKLLLDNGANPNQIDCLGNTPLHLAAVTSKGSVVKLLLNAGTNVGFSDQHGCNPLQLALTKLRMLQNCSGSDMNRVKDEVHEIVSMLLTYLQKQNDTCEQIETLTSFCSRISLSNTTDQVQDDVKDLLASIGALSLTN